MNAQLFKKLIKEAVREAVRDELKQLLAEHAASQLMQPNSILAENLNFNSSNVGPNHYPMTPSQQAAKKAQMEKMFKPQPVQPTNDWSLGADLNRPEPKPVPMKGDFSAFLVDTAMNFNPAEMMGGE